ncbi:MAG: DedA family protein [Deltaproteobacteria bacterium]|nr:DedA family protein [Deltaproteobacteria bacterium]
MEPWLERYGAGAVFGAVFLEGVGVPAPGLTLLVAGALLSAAGRGPPIGVLLASAFAAAVLGNSLGYAVGRLGGRALLRRVGLKDERLEPLERGFATYGGWLIVAARFFDGLKQLNGLAAGVLGMSWRTFSLFNVVGAGLWVALFGLGTYYVDEHVQRARALLRHVNLWVAVGTGVVLLLVIGRLLGTRRSVTDPPG